MEVRELILESVVADFRNGHLRVARHAWRDEGIDAPTVELPAQGGED